MFLEETERVISAHEERIEELSGRKEGKGRQAIDMENLEHILEEEGRDEGDRAMLQLMKQFVTF
jgi:hypothetical protein